MRTINQTGLELIKRFEGTCLTVYLDPVQKPTVGVGHLLTAKERAMWPVGTKLNRLTIDRLLEHDLMSAELAVAHYVKVKISDNAFAALTSFVFNLGDGALKVSTLLKELNAGNYNRAADQFLRWNKAGGKILKGLTLRRKAERELFLA